MNIFSKFFSRDKPRNSTAGAAYQFFFGGTSAGQNVNELANIIMEKIESATARKGAVYA